VNAFEKEFARYHGAKHAIAVDSGTTALFYALKVLGIGENDEVITVANTWASTISAVQETGARCRFAEIDIRTGVLDLTGLESLITPRTRAVLPVHMYGIPVNMPQLMQIARRHGLYVVEDACQAIGASIGEKPVGTWGDMGCYSFHTNKLVGAPADGGMIVTDSSEFAAQVRDISEVKWDRVLDRSWFRVPSRLPPLAVPVLRAKLNRLRDNTSALRRQFERYKTGLTDLPDTWLLDAAGDGQPAHRTCVLVSEQYDLLCSAIIATGWKAGPMYDGSVQLLERLNRRDIVLTQTDYLLRHHLLLPVGRQVTARNQDKLIKAIREAITRGAKHEEKLEYDKAGSAGKRCVNE